MESQEKHEFKKSIVEFLTDWELLDAFELETKPPDTHIIGSRWACKKKYDCTGNFLKYKSKFQSLRIHL